MTLVDLGVASRMLRDALKDGTAPPVTWIYFIQAGERGPIKIGAAQDPQRRMSALQVGNHERLTLLGVYRGLALEEAQLHEDYAWARIHGEWFEPVAQLVYDISRLALPMSFFSEKAPS